MERFKINCEIRGKQCEVQFDGKNIPDEKGLCYMVSIDGLFKGYLKKDASGAFNSFPSQGFPNEELDVINDHLKSPQ